MWVTAIPISSMWPITASVGAAPPAPTRANEVPSVSPCTSANAAAASRQTAAAGSSCPEGPTAVRRSWRRSGIGTACGFKQAAPIVGGDDSFPAHELVVLARERGGSVRLTERARQPSPARPEDPTRVFFLAPKTIS